MVFALFDSFLETFGSAPTTGHFGNGASPQSDQTDVHNVFNISPVMTNSIGHGSRDPVQNTVEKDAVQKPKNSEKRISHLKEEIEIMKLERKETNLVLTEILHRIKNGL